jgi:hypothetical protein
MSDTGQPADEPRIIVDDDYKSRVEQEKEQLRKQMESAGKGSPTGEPEMPPASMPVLVSTLATQALSNLGQIPDPLEGKAVIRKSLAKHFIDTLAMLEEKTKGNLTADESEMLGGTLHQLRMIFVSVPDKMPESQSAGDSGSSSLELPT